MVRGFGYGAVVYKGISKIWYSSDGFARDKLRTADMTWIWPAVNFGYLPPLSMGLTRASMRVERDQGRSLRSFVFGGFNTRLCRDLIDGVTLIEIHSSSSFCYFFRTINYARFVFRHDATYQLNRLFKKKIFNCRMLIFLINLLEVCRINRSTGSKGDLPCQRG